MFSTVKSITDKSIFQNKCNFGCVFWTETWSKVQRFRVQSPGPKSTDSSKPKELHLNKQESMDDPQVKLQVVDTFKLTTSVFLTN